MTREELDLLELLLDKLIQVAPCKMGACVGHLCCDFGVHGDYGETCSIADVKYGLSLIKEGIKR